MLSLSHWLRVKVLVSICLLQVTASAFIEKSFYLGVGYFSENSLGRITKSNSGQLAPLFGTVTYPLLLKYDWRLGSEYFISPTFTYTILNRKDAADSAEVNIWHLIFPIGKNLSSNSLDWYAGPGILNRTIKGSGGPVELNNGNSTATFMLPDRSVSNRVITLDVGISYYMGASRFAFDFMTEGLLSKKRTFDLMLSYAYSFGRGF